MLERADTCAEMECFPKGNPDIQDADSGHCSAHPSGSDYGLQSVQTSLACGVKQEVVISPIAQAKHALRNPWQERKHQADFQAENDIEDDTKLCRHGVDSKW